VKKIRFVKELITTKIYRNLRLLAGIPENKKAGKNKNLTKTKAI